MTKRLLSNYPQKKDALKRKEALAEPVRGPIISANSVAARPDDEEGIETLAVIPGSIIPARKQLGDLLHRQGGSSVRSRTCSCAWTPREMPGLARTAHSQ
jgi:hypothetical protein